jgi:hypothetical protein
MIIAKQIRKDLKAIEGVKFSVRSDYNSVSINYNYVSPEVYQQVKAICNKYQSVARCERTGEILSGGNTYVTQSVEFSPTFHSELRERLASKYNNWDDLPFSTKMHLEQTAAYGE